MKTPNQRVKETLKRYGDQAGEHFGVKQATLNGYIKRGKYPVDLVVKVLAEIGPEQQTVTDPFLGDGLQPLPPPREEPRIVGPKHPAALDARMEMVEQYMQQTVDFYLRQFGDRLGRLEQAVNMLHREQMKHMGVPTLARPDAGVPVEQVFTTNPNAPYVHPLGHPATSGVAPTREMVDAQANDVIIEGVHMRGAELARPAMAVPQVPPFGFGWNQPRPPRK